MPTGGFNGAHWGSSEKFDGGLILISESARAFISSTHAIRGRLLGIQTTPPLLWAFQVALVLTRGYLAVLARLAGLALGSAINDGSWAFRLAAFKPASWSFHGERLVISPRAGRLCEGGVVASGVLARGR